MTTPGTPGILGILGLRSAIYPVKDLSEAKNWYTQVLGTPPYFNEAYYVGFMVGGFELGLMPDGTPGIHGVQALWGVTDADHTMAHLLSLGAKELEPVTDVGGGIRVASVKDPFGNRFGIIQNPHFDPEAVR